MKYVPVYITVDAKLSLPLRECGLKSLRSLQSAEALRSLPLRECGLKFFDDLPDNGMLPFVTPLAGVWIEIDRIQLLLAVYRGHSPCGSVD